MRVIKSGNFPCDKKYKVIHVDKKNKEVILKEKSVFSESFADVAAGAVGAFIALKLLNWVNKK